MSQAQKIRQIN